MKWLRPNNKLQSSSAGFLLAFLFFLCAGPVPPFEAKQVAKPILAEGDHGKEVSAAQVAYSRLKDSCISAWLAAPGGIPGQSQSMTTAAAPLTPFSFQALSEGTRSSKMDQCLC